MTHNTTGIRCLSYKSDTIIDVWEIPTSIPLNDDSFIETTIDFPIFEHDLIRALEICPYLYDKDYMVEEFQVTVFGEDKRNDQRVFRIIPSCLVPDNQAFKSYVLGYHTIDRTINSQIRCEARFMLIEKTDESKNLFYIKGEDE